MKLIVNKYKLLNFFILVLLFFFLELVYRSFIVPLYEYRGFSYVFDSFKYIETKFLFFFILFFVNIKMPSKFLYSIIQILILFALIPNMIIYEYIPTPRFIMYSTSLLIILLHLSAFVSLNIKFPRFSDDISLYFMIGIVLVLLIPIIANYGFDLNYNVLKFQDIYEVRSKSISGIAMIGYLYSWLAKVIVPVLIALSLIKKNYIISLILVLVLLYLFIVQAQKSVFFSLLVVLLFYFITDYYKKIYLFLTVLFLLIVAMHLFSLKTGNIVLESMLVRRVFFVPAILNNYYFDFFSGHSLYLSHSIFSPIYEYPYELPPEKMIGLTYFGSSDMNANNGFISDGFMNFGRFGVILYIFLIVIIFKVFDALKVNSHYFGVFFVMIFTFISSSFLTSLFTHGILILLILAFFVMQYRKTS